MSFVDCKKIMTTAVAEIISAACALSLCSCALFSEPETTFTGKKEILDAAPQIVQQKKGESIRTLSYVMKDKGAFETVETYYDFRGERPKASFIVFSTKSGEKKELSRMVYDGEKMFCVVNGEKSVNVPPVLEPSILFSAAVAKDIYSVARHMTITETENLGKPCYQIDIYPKEEFNFIRKFIIFLDADTKCIVRQDASMMVNGVEIMETIYYSDFKDYNGFTFYGKCVSDRDFATVTLVTDSVSVNKAILPEVFATGLPEQKEQKK